LKFPKKEALLFDLDGTLIDSVPDLALAANVMLEKLGRSTFDEEYYREWVGNGARVMVQRALSGASELNPNLDKALVDRALSIYIESYKANICVETRLYPEVESTLNKLRSLGYQLAVVTNKPEFFIVPILESLGVADLFCANVGGGTVSECKPSPAQLLYACEKMGVTVEQSIMIGDSKNDILAAKACEMHSIGLTYGYNYGEHIAIHGPDVVVDEFGDILNYIL